MSGAILAGAWIWLKKSPSAYSFSAHGFRESNQKRIHESALHTSPRSEGQACFHSRRFQCAAGKRKCVRRYAHSRDVADADASSAGRRTGDCCFAPRQAKRETRREV